MQLIVITKYLHVGRSTPCEVATTAMASKHASYTLAASFKLKVIERAEKCGNRVAGYKHSINEKLV